MRIILLGPPGAGKGTQAKTLAQRLHLVHISTGDILRQNVAEKTSLGREAKDFMEKGALVPDALVTQMLAQRIVGASARKGFILDGFPRNIAQAEALDGMLKKQNIDIDWVVYLDTSETVIIKRLTGRVGCAACGANFHLRNMPPKIPEVCDTCGGRLYQRPDDKEETIMKRLEVYREESAPLIQYYQERKKLFRINADLEAEEVLNKIIQFIEKSHDSCKV